MAVGFEFQTPTLKIYKISDKQETELTGLQAKSDWAGLKKAAEKMTASPQFFAKTVVLSKSVAGWYAAGWRRRGVRRHADPDRVGRCGGTGTLDAPIFEFRAPGVGANVMSYTAWGDYAFKAYRFLAAVNVLSKETPIDETKVFTLA